MPRWFVPASLAVILSFVGPSATGTTAAGAVRATARQPQASLPTDLTARRRDWRYRRYIHQPNGRTYYYSDRPRYYAPAPFFPLFGLGYGPW